MIAVVAGATGLVGEILTRELLDDPDVQQVKVAVRKPMPFSDPKLVTVIVPDFSGLELFAPDLEGSHFFCALGTTIKKAGSREKFREVDFDAVVAFAKVAIRSSARNFALVSATGADEKSRIFYNRVKGETERALQELPFRSLKIYRPGLLLGERREKRGGEKAAMSAAVILKPVLPASWFKSVVTEAERLARRMIADAKKTSTGREIIPAREI